PEPDLPEVEELIKRIVSDARRAASVIARVRSMALRRAPEHERLSLDDVIRESLLFLGHEFQSQRVTVVHHPASDLDARVVADRTQLQQVVVNLAVNAGQALAQSSAGERKIGCCHVKFLWPERPGARRYSGETGRNFPCIESFEAM